jgi:uncharacterized protein YdaU (DUF1376 family)
MAKGEEPKPEWFRFFPADFIEDEDVVSMDLQERGAYITLLCRQWKNGSIPSDIPSLARMLKVTQAEMERMWAGLGHCFQPHPTEEGRLAQGRLEEERRDSIGKMEKDRKRPRRVPKSSDGTPKEHQGTDTGRCSVSVSVPSSKKEIDANCDTFRALYPAHRLDNYGATCFISASDQAGILERLRLAVKSEDWTRENGRYVPKASKWVLDGAPAPAMEPDPASASPSVVSTMDPETRRRLDERRRNA